MKVYVVNFTHERLDEANGNLPSNGVAIGIAITPETALKILQDNAAKYGMKSKLTVARIMQDQSVGSRTFEYLSNYNHAIHHTIERLDVEV